MRATKGKNNSVDAAASLLPPKKRKAATKLTPEQLMADPKHMLSWLRAKKPTAIVTDNVGDCEACLGANFIAAHGHRGITFGGFSFGSGWSVPAWFLSTTMGLPWCKPITAKRAISAILAATVSS